MELLKRNEISAKIMTLVDEAETLFIAVSPYVRIGKWEKMKKILGLLRTRPNVKAEFYVRADQPEAIEELAAIGVKPFLVPNLHAKLYFNERSAIVTSLNLLGSSDASSIEIAYQTESDEEYGQLFHYFERHIRGNADAARPTQPPAKPLAKPERQTRDRGELSSVREGLRDVTDVEVVSLHERTLTVKTRAASYDCFVWSGARPMRLRISCSLPEERYRFLKSYREVISGLNFYVEVEFQDSRSGYPSLIWGTGKDAIEFDTIQEVLEHDFSRFLTRLYYFIKSIEGDPPAGVFA